MTRWPRWLMTALVACGATTPALAVDVLLNEVGFRQRVVSPATVSFDAFGVGSLPQSSLQLDAVNVELTASAVAPIFGPGPYGFTTNFLALGVRDDANKVVIHFPAGTRAAGIKIASDRPVTVTPSGRGVIVISYSSDVSFIGFIEPDGLSSITISAFAGPPPTPIARLGDITYGSTLISDIPSVSATGLVVLTVLVLLAGMAIVHRHAAG